ncbi:MAG: SDR family oxidoreductase [Candidatus Krumholzibacteriota bacterium]|nr:SDR family oxidoreductase [Candidatus Krumholzibacteriota bacterium]
MNINLGGKVILVTGGNRGIGGAISRALAAEGARVAVHYKNRSDDARLLVEKLGGGSKSFRADLSRPGSAYTLFREVLDRFGKVDVLVNNAGVFMESPVRLEGADWLEIWNTTLAINLTAAGILCHAALRHFMENSGGRIINIASRAAFRGETEDYLAYAASKGGLVSLSRSIARSFGRYNIQAFTIAPGFVRTEMSKDFLEENEARVVEEELSLDRITEPEDIAPLVAFIAGGMMDHATGSTIDVNAGSYMR